MRMDKKDREIRVIGVLSAVCFVALAVFFPRNVTEASQPIVKEVEHYVYQPVRKEEVQRAVEPYVVSKTTKYIYEATDEEKELMARVVMSEGSLLPLEGKQAIAQTIINRMRSSLFPNNIEAVINQPYQYSTADNGDPDAECYEAVDAALKYEGFPIDMYYFRTGHYHTFAEDYCQIGNTYFSTERSKK
jgi:hypothetical protein